jgi:hypothetical protein
VACILLESVDGGGKSTLADRIADTFTFLTEDLPNPPVLIRVHKGQPAPGLDAFQEYELPLERFDLCDLIRSKDDLVIMDRWHGGEIPYGTIYRDHSRLTMGGLLHVEMTLTAMGVVKVLAQPDNVDIVRMRLHNRGEDFLRPEHVDRVHAWYESLGSLYDYVRGPETTPSELLELARDRALGGKPAAPLSWSGYVGSPTPRLLLVGDQRNDGPRSRLEFPRAFTPWDAAGSAAYLMSTLVLGDMRRDVGIVNAHELGVNLVDVEKLDPRPTVVALGRLASKTLTNLGIEHEAVPHPQYVRRFRNKQMSWYAQEIKEAARWK